MNIFSILFVLFYFSYFSSQNHFILSFFLFKGVIFILFLFNYYNLFLNVIE